MTEALSEPKPVQKPHPPLWIGGAGERRTLRVVAEFADGWNTFFLPEEAYEHKLEVLATHCQEVGRDPTDIRKQLVVQMVLGETDPEVEEATRRVAAARKMDVAQLRQTAVIGTTEQAAERLGHYVRMGVGDFLIGARIPADMRTLELVATKVAPAVRTETRTATV